jgi:hypothetical protein
MTELLEKQSPYVKAYLNPDTGKIERRSIGSAIKASDENRVSGYLVRFTSKDDKDLQGEYFDKTTNFWLREHPLKGKPILLDHAFDEAFKSIPVGIINFVKEDNIGIWIEGKLNDRQEYEEMLLRWKDRRWIDLDPDNIRACATNMEKAVKTFFKTGKAQWSSGALQQSVEVNESGHIDSWAIIEGTGVMTPAEPDGTEIGLKSAFKAIGNILDSIQTDAAHEDGTAREDVSSLDVEKNKPKTHNRNNGETLMGFKLPIKTRSKTRDFIRQMLEEAQAEIEAVVEMIADEMGVDVAPDDAANIAEQAETAIEEAVDESGADEETMAMLDDDDENKMDEEDEKKAKSLRASIRKAALKVMASRTVQYFADKQREADKERKQLVGDALKDYGRSQRGHSKVGKANGFNGMGNSHISVGESLKFAHLTAEEMAMGYMLLESQYPVGRRGRVPARDVVSDDYLRHMVGKSLHQIKDERNFANIRDYMAVKAAIPYKTDDFDATDISGQGQDWVGTLYGSRLWEKARDETKVFNELVSRGLYQQEIPQGQSSVVIPTEGADPIAYSTPQANDLDATNRVEATANIGFIGTGSKTLSAAQIKIAGAATDELVEDSIIPFLTQMNQQIQVKSMETIDQALINGDTDPTASTNINLIDDTPGTGINRPYYLAVNGLRKYPLVTATSYADTAGGAAPTLDLFRQLLKEFSSAVREQSPKLFYLIDSDTHNVSLAIPEIATDDVRRTNATIESGRLLNIYGVDVITSGFLPLTNTAGKVSVTGSNNVKGQVLLVYAPFWAFGWKRKVRVDTEYSAISGTTVSVASMRFGFVNRGADASAIRYNIGVAG